jgi:hypothetical protein
VQVLIEVNDISQAKSYLNVSNEDQQVIQAFQDAEKFLYAESVRHTNVKQTKRPVNEQHEVNLNHLFSPTIDLPDLCFLQIFLLSKDASPI